MTLGDRRCRDADRSASTSSDDDRAQVCRAASVAQASSRQPCRRDQGRGEEGGRERRAARSPASPWRCRPPASRAGRSGRRRWRGIGKGAPITAIAAGTAAAIAEQWCGAARGVKQVITFSIAEHVTAGVLDQRQALARRARTGVSVGWLALNPVEREDYRRYGGLEAEVAAAGIVRRFVWRIKSGDRLDGRRSGQGRLLEDHRRRHPAGRARPATAFRSRSCATPRSTSAWRSPTWRRCSIRKIVVLGGMHRLVRRHHARADPRRDARAACCPQQAEQVRIVLSTLGDDAVAIGAARAPSRAGA